MDFWVGSVLIFILAMIQAILYGWVLGIEKGDEEAHRGANIRIPKFVQYMLKYVVPVYLLAIFIGFAINNVPGYIKTISEKPAAQGTIAFVLLIFGFLMLMVHIAGRRWEKEGRLTYGDAPTESPTAKGQP
jgi:hypothetical protein